MNIRYHRPKWMQPPAVESPTVFTLCVFAALYLTAVICIRQSAWRDPTSIFFQPGIAYKQQYSDFRHRQSEEFLQDLQGAVDDPSLLRAGRGNQTSPEICIGIPSIARQGVRYLRNTLGSLLEGLPEEERERIHLILFFADIDPNDHPAYNEPWITGLADDVLVYDLPDSEIERLSHMGGREKGMFDFCYVLNACYATGAPYVTLIEDDVLAVDGWLSRTMTGLEEVQRHTAKEGGKNDWIYLRLFYTEEFLGWNGEFVGAHIGWSIALIVFVFTVLICIRVLSPKGVGPYLPNSLILSVCCICLPLCITLFFTGGRVTLFPHAHGVSKMEQNGCCSQGLVFNRAQAPGLLDFLEHTPSGHFFDMKVEQYADEHPYLHRWALHPPVLQHTGMKSSSNEELKREVAEKIWSFEFEMYDPYDIWDEKKRKSAKEELV